ncbi:MAG: L-histidine N(alpha)-methyltransferase [Rubrivivax sp.]
MAPKFFYDALGSRLFDAITELPEYYPTRTEAAIFAADGAAIAEAALACSGVARRCGPGRGQLRQGGAPLHSAQPRRYVAVDISVAFLRQALEALQREHPALELAGVAGLLRQVRVAATVARWRRRACLLPGVEHRQLAPDEALRLLREARALALGGGAVDAQGGLIMRRRPREGRACALEAAYDDVLGVTAAFNLNVLRRLNALLGADVDPAQWRHGRFDVVHSRIEMHLEARHALTVH